MTTTSHSKIKFTNARLLAVQALYAHAVSDASWDKVTSRFLLGEMGGEVILETGRGEEYMPIEGADADLFARLMKAAETNADTIERAIRDSLSDTIQYDRLELTVLCILRAGMAEFFANTSPAEGAAPDPRQQRVESLLLEYTQRLLKEMEKS